MNHPLLNPCPTCGQNHTEMRLTLAQAKVIKGWRVGRYLAWSDVAILAHNRWPEQIKNAHQVTGRRLCTEAALLLGEDPGVDPWN